MPITLYVASSNPGKLRDFRVAAEQIASDQTAAQQTSIEILPLPNLADIPAPDETGATFAANARLKSEYYSLHLPGQLVLADDSGLEVPALHNAPGVRSARYAEDANFLPNPIADSAFSIDARNNLLLLKQMNGERMSSHTARAARYRCVLSLARNGAEILSAEGTVPGEILTAPRGTGGFGYDPLFYLPQLGKTMAEIDLTTKHHLSHRGAALRALLLQLQ